jgi:hypothetical protein
MNKTSPKGKLRDGSKEKASKKRSAKRLRQPALVPTPSQLVDLLTLVNQLPVELRRSRQESWSPASRRVISGETPKIVRWQRDLLDGTSTGMSYASLWLRLVQAVEELPLKLQAFLLRDELGDIVEESDGYPTPVYVESDLQIIRNFELLRMSESELREIVRRSLDKVDEAARFEEGEDEFLQNRVSPTTLIKRVHQRLIYSLAALELLSCLTQVNAKQELRQLSITRLSDATYPRPYIDEEGRFELSLPILFYRLRGIEVFRIKECAVCYRIFWAGRKDMRCCEAKCSHILRSRKYRDAYKKEYAYQRYRREEDGKRRAGDSDKQVVAGVRKPKPKK